MHPSSGSKRGWAPRPAVIAAAVLLACGLSNAGPAGPPSATQVELLSASFVEGDGRINYRGLGGGDAVSLGTRLVAEQPSGTSAGDVILVRIVNRAHVEARWKVPAGWVLIRSDNSRSQIKQWLYYKVAGESEPETYTFEANVPSNATLDIMALYNVDTRHPIDAHAGTVNAHTRQLTSPVLTTDVPNTFVLWYGSQAWDSSDWETCPDLQVFPGPWALQEGYTTCLLDPPIEHVDGLYVGKFMNPLEFPGSYRFDTTSDVPNTNIVQMVALQPAHPAM